MRRGFTEENKDHSKKKKKNHENTASKEINEAIKEKHSGKRMMELL